MPVRNDLTKFKRDVTAVSKLLDSHETISKPQAVVIKALLNSLITLVNSIIDGKVDKQ